jgi:hypothetical protein
LSATVLGIGWVGGGITALAVVAVVIGVAAIVSVLQNSEFSGAEKAVWVVAILLFPILGGAVYFAVRSDW